MFDPALASAETAGHIFGALLLALFAGLGIFRCFVSMRAPEASKPCYLALVCLLASWISNAASLCAQRFLDGPLAAIAGALSVLLLVVLILAAISFAIVGLSTYGSHREIPHTRGRKHAIWALVLSMLPVTVGVFSVFSAAVDSGGWVEESSKDQGEVRNPDLNFRFTSPDRPWVALNAKVHNQDATLMYRKPRPEALFTLIAEAPGTVAGFTKESLADIARANLEANQGIFEFESLPDRTVNGIQYTVFRTKATKFLGHSGTHRWEHWVAVPNGYAYQLVSYAETSDPEVISAAASDMAVRFHLLDPGKVLSVPGEPVDPFSDPATGISIDLSSGEWQDYENRETDYPEAAFAASSGLVSTGASYLNLGELDPGIDELASGLLAAGFEMLHPKDTIGRTEIEQGDVSGIEVSASRTVDAGEYDYRFRILRRDTHAWLLAAWRSEEKEADLSAILDAYEIGIPVPVEGSPGPSKAAVTEIAQALNQIGLAYYRREAHEPSIPYFREAFRRDPETTQYFENEVDGLYQMGRFEELVELVRARPGIAAERLVLSAYEGASLRALGRHEEAADAYEKGFDAGYANEDDLLDFINSLVETEQQERGVEALESFREKNPGASESVERWKSSLLSQIERYDESISVLEELLEKNPSSYRISADLADRQIDAGRYSEGLATVDSLLEGGSRNSELLVLRGRAKLGLESYREAKQAFEEALEIDPNDGGIVDYIDHASTLLGKGNISLIKEVIEPVPLPSGIAELAQRLREKHGADLSPEYGAVMLERISGKFYEPGKPQKSTTRTVVKITGPTGLDDYSTLQFSFDPSYESLHVGTVEVTNDAGEVLGTGNVENYFLVDRNDDSLATTEKVVHVPVPGIAIGTTLTYTVTTEDHSDSDEFDFGSIALNDTYPSVGKIVYFVTDPANIATVPTDGVSELPMEGGVAFYSDGPGMRHYESMQTWAQSFHPWLHYSDPGLDWETEALEYLERLAPVSEKDSEEAATKAEEIAGKAGSEAEKIAALAQFVSRTLTYQGIEFGPRGQIPDRFSTILKHRYGDCKDHSLLLVKLLQGAGIEAHLALVSTDAPLVPSLPSLDQFNHMIVHVPGAVSPFIDPTVDHFAHGAHAPFYLVGEQALVLDPDNPRLEKIELTPTSVTKAESHRKIRLDPDDAGAILVEERLLLDGYSAGWFRDYFDDWRAPDYAKEIAAMLDNYGTIEVREVKPEGLGSIGQPLSIDLLYSVPRAVSRKDDRISITPPAFWERYFLERRDTGKRHNPFEILVPSEFTSRATYSVPGKEADTAHIESLAIAETDEFTEWRVSSKAAEDGAIEIESLGTRKTGTHPADRFDDFVDAANRGFNVLGKRLEFTGPAEE